MEYSIRELSQLSGVTTRTLRWYDEIGLLKPAYVAESGYRYYREAEVDRLQDILYYRELECRKLRLDQLIQSVKDTIYAEEKQEMMNDEQKFEAFQKRAVEKHEECYGQEAREKYGDREVDEVQETMKNLTREQYQEWTCLGRRNPAAPGSGCYKRKFRRRVMKEETLQRFIVGGLRLLVTGMIRKNTRELRISILWMNGLPPTMTEKSLAARSFCGMRWSHWV